jgi:hypothetical protein
LEDANSPPTARGSADIRYTQSVADEYQRGKYFFTTRGPRCKKIVWPQAVKREQKFLQ